MPSARISTAESVAPQECLLRPEQVAVRFNVSPRTVTYWAWRGKLPSVRTPGGQYRFRPSDVNALMEAESLIPASGPVLVGRAIKKADR